MAGDRGILAGQRALVTGAAKRIGRAVALRLAEAGADVVVQYRSSAHEAERTADDIRATGVQVWTLPGDLSVPEAAEDLMARAWETAGGLDILVNSAASFPGETVDEMTVDGLRAVLDLVAVTPLFLSRAFAARTRAGCIVNILDTRINAVDPAHAGYQLAKKMLASVTELSAAVFAPGIRVNGVAPGLVLPPPGLGEGHLTEREQLTLTGRHGDPGDVADAVVYLAGAKFVTGEIVRVDGGQHIRTRMYRQEG